MCAASAKSRRQSKYMLGNRKLQRLASLILLLTMVAGCSQTPQPSSPKPPSRAQSPDVLFHIRLAGSHPPADLSGVEVSLVTGDGRVVPVVTSVDGRARVSKARIRELRATVILFCRQGTFCGAVLVSQGDGSILEYDEYYLELAQLVVV